MLFLQICGLGFVSYIGQYGYDRLMRVLGRQLRDFLNGLDNLHDYLRFTYPKVSRSERTLKTESYPDANFVATGVFR